MIFNYLYPLPHNLQLFRGGCFPKVKGVGGQYTLAHKITSSRRFNQNLQKIYTGKSQVIYRKGFTGVSEKSSRKGFTSHSKPSHATLPYKWPYLPERRENAVGTLIPCHTSNVWQGGGNMFTSVKNGDHRSWKPASSISSSKTSNSFNFEKSILYCIRLKI